MMPEELVMLKSVEGTYRNGHIDLAELPEDLGEARVIVTFLPSPPPLPRGTAAKQLWN